MARPRPVGGSSDTFLTSQGVELTHVEVAGFVIACFALLIAGGSLGWQVFTWRQGRRMDVRVRVTADEVVVASGELNVTVTVENGGSTHEAVQEVWLLYAESAERDGANVLGPPNIRKRMPKEAGDLPPRRNVRVTFDLLGSRFITHLPTALEGIVLLESGHQIRSSLLEISGEDFRLATGLSVTPRIP